MCPNRALIDVIFRVVLTVLTGTVNAATNESASEIHVELVWQSL